MVTKNTVEEISGIFFFFIDILRGMLRCLHYFCRWYIFSAVCLQQF